MRNTLDETLSSGDEIFTLLVTYYLMSLDDTRKGETRVGGGLDRDRMVSNETNDAVERTGNAANRVSRSSSSY